MLAVKMIEVATNKRVGSRVGQCSLFESTDSNVWSVCFWRDRSDPAAHAKHYAQMKKMEKCK